MGKVQPTPQLNAPSSKGQPLPANLRHNLEAEFGVDLSALKVHVGHEATMLGAEAYSTGDNIFLAPAQEHHLPHEAAHVVQQRTGISNQTNIAKGLVEVEQNGQTP